MTKKDYIAIASVIAITGPSTQRMKMVNALIPIFKADNPRFDADRFREAANG